MLKKSLYAAVTASVIAISGNANAKSMDYSAFGLDVKPYLSANGQFVLGHKDDAKATGSGLNVSGTVRTKDGLGFGAAAGAEINKNYRAEAEFGYRRNKAKNEADAGTSAYSYMVNGYYDFKNSSPVTPYFGAGVGLAHVKLYEGTTNTAASDNVFAYQFMTGLSYDIDANNTVYTGYRYFGTQDAVLKSGGIKSKIAYDRNSIEAGYRYKF